jgi:hypothetical protein
MFGELFMDFYGQYALEYILIVGFSILVSLTSFAIVSDINELNTIMASARSGVLLGSEMDSLAIYPHETYDNYVEKHPRLKCGSKVTFIRIEYEKNGYDPVYKKKKIMLKIYATTNSVYNYDDRECIGDRINYYVRRSICNSYKTENLTNCYYNPAFSNNYFITTYDVKWV